MITVIDSRQNHFSLLLVYILKNSIFNKSAKWQRQERRRKLFPPPYITFISDIYVFFFFFWFHLFLSRLSHPWFRLFSASRDLVQSPNPISPSPPNHRYSHFNHDNHKHQFTHVRPYHLSLIMHAHITSQQTPFNY